MERAEVIELIENCMTRYLKNIDKKLEEFCKGTCDPNCTSDSSNANENTTDQPTTSTPETLNQTLQNLSSTVQKTSNPKRNLRFEDIAKSFKEFHGDSHLSVNSWLTHFDEQSEIFELNEFGKFVYAK